MTMYRIKIDIVENSGLTNTNYGKNIYNDIEAARFAATETRKRLFNNYANGEIKDYKVNVIPFNY